MGWDDNGLPTERRVQNYYGVRCDPSLPYDPAFAPPEKPGKQPISVSRPNFIELCDRLTAEDEKAFEHLWRYLGLSVDWSMTYATIGKTRAARVAARVPASAAARPRVSARSADAVGRRLPDGGRAGRARRSRAARRVSPHPVRDRARHRTRGPCRRDRDDAARADSGLRGARRASRRRALPAAVRAARWSRRSSASRVPVRPHPLADPEKGSGIAMICTFGDITDVTWWRELSLPVRAVIQPDGTLRPVTWGAPGWESADAARAQQFYDQLDAAVGGEGARGIVEQLRESGDLVGEPRPITHAVKFYEKGDRPLEIVTSRQWFIKTMEFREALLARGARARVASAVHAGALRELDERPERRLVRQPPAILRRAVSGLVSARREGRVDYGQPLMPARRSRCRSIRRPTCRRATARTSAASRVDSSAIRTSWTRGRPRR